MSIRSSCLLIVVILQAYHTLGLQSSMSRCSTRSFQTLSHKLNSARTVLPPLCMSSIAVEPIEPELSAAGVRFSPEVGLEPGSCDPYDPSSAEYCSPKDQTIRDEVSDGGLKRKLKLAGLFTLWYVLNTAYNIGNKLVLTALPIPWTSATLELFFGFPYVLLLWSTGMRKAPKLSLDNIKTLAPSGFFLAGTHVGGVISFGAGAISFTHVIKATEPVWTALISAVCFREFLPMPVYLSLVPIIGGVGLASMKELTFTWVSFVSALLSAVASASKAILSKKVLDGKPLGENLTPANMVSDTPYLLTFLVTTFSHSLSLPTLPTHYLLTTLHSSPYYRFLVF